MNRLDESFENYYKAISLFPRYWVFKFLGICLLIRSRCSRAATRSRTTTLVSCSPRWAGWRRRCLTTSPRLKSTRGSTRSRLYHEGVFRTGPTTSEQVHHCERPFPPFPSASAPGRQITPRAPRAGHADYYDAQNNVRAAREQLEQMEREASTRKRRAGGLYLDLPDAADASEDMMRATLRRLTSEARARRKRAPPGARRG